jgi:hypothetical protein
MFNNTNTKAKRWELGGQQTWQNSSHVGETINANGKALWPPWGQPQWHVSHDMMGQQKAAALPDPVCAQAIRFLPARKIRMACFCTGMGFTYCHASSDVV